MIEEIKDLEKDFANNNYYGTNVWTDEKYRVISGTTKVMISSPHSVNQIRGEEVRNAEKFTGGITRYLAKSTSSFAIFQLFTHEDPNNLTGENYKNAIVNLLNTYDIKYLLDIHSSSFKDSTDIDLVTNNRESLCGKDNLITYFSELGYKYNIRIAEKNMPNPEKKAEIIGVSSLICNVPSIRIVINNKSLEDEEKLVNIINLLIEFIDNIKK